MTPPPPHDVEALLEQSGWIRSLARSLVGSDADDLVQETWAVALERPPAQDRPLRPWLARVAKNLALNRRRAKRHRGDREAVVASEARAVAPLPSPDELVERSEQQREVAELVHRLSEPSRSTLLLRYFEGLSPAEIALRQGLAVGAVRTRLSRGLAELRSELDARHGGVRERWVQGLVPLAAWPTGALTSSPIDAVSAKPMAAQGSASSWSVTTLVSLAAMPAFVKLSLVAVTVLATLLWVRGGITDGLEPVKPAPELAGGTLEDAAPLGDVLEASSGAHEALSSAPQDADLTPATAVPSTGRVRWVNRLTGAPVHSVRFQDASEETQQTRGPGPPTPPNAVTAADANGVVDLPLATTALRPTHVWQSELALRDAFASNWSTSRPSGERVEWDGLEGTVAMDVGPSVWVHLALPRGVEITDVIALLGDHERPNRWGSRASLIRSVNGRAFVRFAHREQEQARDNWIHFITLDGRFAHSALADDYLDADKTLPVRLEERATLRTEVTVTDGREVGPMDAFLFGGHKTVEDIEIPAIERVPLLRSGIGGMPERATFTYDALTPGTYTLAVVVHGCALHWETLDLFPGVTEHSVTVERTAATDQVLEGRITSRTGAMDMPLRVVATDDDMWSSSAERYTDVVWQDEGARRVGTFRIEGLAQKEYRLAIIELEQGGDQGLVQRMLPPRPLTATPGQLCEVELNDDQPVTTLLVKAIDHTTKEPVKEFMAVIYMPGTQDVAAGQAFDGSVVVQGVLELKGAKIMVNSDQYGLFDIELPAVEPGGTYVAELVQGWWARVGVRDAEGRPIPGADVLVDGTVVATTDADGNADVQADVAPDTIGVRATGWTNPTSPSLGESGRLKGRYEESGGAIFIQMTPNR